MKTLFNLSLVLLLSLSTLTAQSVAGIWKTIDDETNEAKSYVEITIDNNELSGHINKLLKSPETKRCSACKGNKKNELLLGLQIIEGLTKDDDEWNSGEILDPETGKIYKCSIWLEEGNLKVRGKHWTGLYRTQTWYRVE